MRDFDEKGEWVTLNGARILVVPSQEFLSERQASEMEQNLLPNQTELEEAEYELKLITKLMEWGIL